jgi:hypothetical protein
MGKLFDVKQLIFMLLAFFIGTTIYGFIAAATGVLDKIQIGFSLGFIVLLALVLVIYNWLQTKVRF